jgi:hypothetical protein
MNENENENEDENDKEKPVIMTSNRSNSMETRTHVETMKPRNIVIRRTLEMP